jgi:hypothetical protein
MNIEEFKVKYASFKDVEKIEITCDHPQHEPKNEIIIIGKQPAKRNILKNNSKQFICRKCYMHHNNPIKQIGENRQTEEIVNIYCTHPDHNGNPCRQMKKRNYYGLLQEPYLQLCGSCIKLGKKISEEQKEKIRIALTGIKRSDEFKEKLSFYMKNNPEGIARATKNIIENHCTTGMLGKFHSNGTKQKMSDSHVGKKFSEEHCKNISDGRKKMLEESGGFTREHRENISKATVEQYRNGFNPNLHHLSGWHESPKADKVFYRSSYEKKAYLKLDADESVKKYYVEKIEVEYFNPLKKITSSYIIDILIEYKDGSKKLIEVKPEKWLSDEVIICKIEAAKTKSKELGIPFEVWTEINLFGPVYNEKHIRSFVQKMKAKNK